MKRPRPYIPISVRLEVVARQFRERGKPPPQRGLTSKDRLAFWLLELFGEQPPGEPLHLDHDPPLAARTLNPYSERYDPDANDPNFLLYRTKKDHLRKTNLRGDGAQFPDRVLIKRERRRLKKLQPVSIRKPKRMSAPTTYRKPKPMSAPKKKWPSRPLQSRSTFPKGRK